MNSKSENVSTQQYSSQSPQITRDMQNITIIRGEFRMYPKALENALISSSGFKQGLVKDGYVA